MRRMLIGSTAAACALALVTAGGAFARAGDRTAAETYPVASALCVKAHANTIPPKLVASRTQVLTACDTLLNAYGPLVATVDGAEATLLGTLSTQKGLVAAACPKPVANATACQNARASALSVDTAAHTTESAAVAQFHSSVEANRNAFWTTVQSLRSSG
jgi:hypothetical protein